MPKDKLKLDCTGCGASLFQTENPQVYKCEKCDTSFKIKFDSDGINLVVIEKKFKSLIEDVISFKEKIKKNELKLNCLICGSNIYQKSIPEAYECNECQLYYKPILDDGKVKLIKPDRKTIYLLELEKKQDKLDDINRSLKTALIENKESKNSGCFIHGFGILLISIVLFVIIYEGILYIDELDLVWIVLEDAPWVLLIFPISFIAMWRHNKSSKKKSINIKELQQHKSDLIKEIDSIESVLDEM